MKRKMAATLAIATVAMLILFVALPLFVAPATASNIQAVDNNQSEKSVEPLQIPDIGQWFQNNNFFKDFMLFNLSNTNFSGVFTHTRLTNTKFGLNFAKIVEFNDTDGDGFYNNFDGSDDIKSYDLPGDFYYVDFNITYEWTGFLPNWLQLELTFNESSDAFQVKLGITLYLKTTTVTFNETKVTIPSSATLKFGLEVLGYDWDPETGELPYSSRYLALVIALNGSITSSIPHWFQLANGTVIDSGAGAVVTLQNGNVCEIYFVDASGVPRAKFNWFNGANNGTDDARANSYFSVNNQTVNISIAFSYDDFEYGNLIIDPYFQLLEQNPLLLILTLVGIGLVIAGQALSTLLLYGGIAAVILIGIIVVLVRRR